jgi:hypothetical protein
MAYNDIMMALCPELVTKFFQALSDDILPSGESEEKVWGLYGDPRSANYQRVYG